MARAGSVERPSARPARAASPLPCPRCGQDDDALFYPNQARASGRDHLCVACRRAATAAWRAANGERERARRRQRRAQERLRRLRRHNARVRQREGGALSPRLKRTLHAEGERARRAADPSFTRSYVAEWRRRNRARWLEIKRQSARRRREAEANPSTGGAIITLAAATLTQPAQWQVWPLSGVASRPLHVAASYEDAENWVENWVENWRPDHSA